MNTGNLVIRKAVEADSEQLWQLMKELAVFEQYIDSFAITPEIVKERGFRKDPPDFYSFVAVDEQRITGMLVYYFIPYTAQNKPAIYLKELYVSSGSRGQKTGERLMEALREEAINQGCSTIKWTVAPWNEAGMRFYQRLGARENKDWLNYEWSL